MLPVRPAKILRIHISESDRFADKPLYEAIVAKCREMKIAGATVFRGLEGYGETADLHLARNHQPIVIVIVDSDGKIEEFAPVVESMMATGVLAMSHVEVVRIDKSASNDGTGTV